MDQRLFRSPLVCVVDDDDAVRRALEFALDLEGFAVESFATGEDLLSRDDRTPPACLIIDERLPGASGLETLRRLRARAVDAPAILVTTHPKPALRAAAASAGVAILEKPLLGDSLVSAIRELLAAQAH